MNYPNMKEGKSMYFNIEFPNKMAHAYSVMCKPLCQEMKLPQTAFDILMFLSNNPQYKTARDIVEVRKIKANLVSINVDKLVKEGYLERREVTGDRRKTELVCTSKADFIIEKGRLVQKTFKDTLFNNMDDSMKEILFKGIEIMEDNLDRILEDQ
ncbi:MarR family winged helix-turn-helix transcriptional regulator [Catenibacterium sp.]|nr:helix-turn-helix domain-containing protein [Catenibacterium sp.]